MKGKTRRFQRYDLSGLSEAKGLSKALALIRPSFSEISTYLERQYDDILAEESRIKRNPRFRDNRVHALLYFIPPTGHAYDALLCLYR
jgi:septin family protein